MNNIQQIFDIKDIPRNTPSVNNMNMSLSSINFYHRENIKFIKLDIKELNYDVDFWNKLLFDIYHDSFSTKSLNNMFNNLQNNIRVFDTLQYKNIKSIIISPKCFITYWKTTDNKLILMFNQK
jgi:hypothetical protein